MPENSCFDMPLGEECNPGEMDKMDQGISAPGSTFKLYTPKTPEDINRQGCDYGRNKYYKIDLEIAQLRSLGYSHESALKIILRAVNISKKRQEAFSRSLIKLKTRIFKLDSWLHDDFARLHQFIAANNQTVTDALADSKVFRDALVQEHANNKKEMNRVLITIILALLALVGSVVFVNLRIGISQKHESRVQSNG